MAEAEVCAVAVVPVSAKAPKSHAKNVFLIKRYLNL
jgi:hypothetical protein